MFVKVDFKEIKALFVKKLVKVNVLKALKKMERFVYALKVNKNMMKMVVR